ncbi:MAG: isochorismatase family protein [Prevotella sp.]|jgi:nicotinamidase/pyrazinamidase|nr:isochorismatase family protein [Prevotella sp.]MCH3984852.1 isochorismatase family protein [Prevotella sp.]MCH3992523.1 isochorismatase family protein [Prevotella sp.]MCH4016889.1 isochorismatase family protein [Prevotella sp.]MCH4099071.1 isochorismatase family protein [Prevotella sp.]
MKRMLLIIDPQIDFINGALPVPGAAKALNALSKYILQQDGEYDCKIVTADWHPYHHCSFKENGGEWPMHCVQNSTGAAFFPALFKPLYTTHGTVTVLYKGTDEGAEEYSIFKNSLSAGKLRSLIRDRNIGQIDICGLAGDICVLNTLRDGIKIYGAKTFHVLKEYAPSLDGGASLEKAIQTLLG